MGLACGGGFRYLAYYLLVAGEPMIDALCCLVFELKGLGEVGELGILSY